MMTNKQICDLYEGLYWLGQEKQMKFKPLISYKLAHNKILLEPYYKAIKECEKGILQQFGEEQEDGSFLISNDRNKVQMANKALEELRAIETDVVLDKIDINDFNEDISMDLIEKLILIIK